MPDQGPSWDLAADLQFLLQFHFMQNAFLAGTLVALLRDRERRLALRRSGQKQAAGFTWSETIRRTTAAYAAVTIDPACRASSA